MPQLSSIRNLKDYKHLFDENKNKLKLKIKSKVENLGHFPAESQIHSQKDTCKDTMESVLSFDSVNYDPIDEIKIKKKNQKNPRYQILNSGLFQLKQIDQILDKKIVENKEKNKEKTRHKSPRIISIKRGRKDKSKSNENSSIKINYSNEKIKQTDLMNPNLLRQNSYKSSKNSSRSMSELNTNRSKMKSHRSDSSLKYIDILKVSKKESIDKRKHDKLMKKQQMSKDIDNYLAANFIDLDNAESSSYESEKEERIDELNFNKNTVISFRHKPVTRKQKRISLMKVPFNKITSCATTRRSKYDNDDEEELGKFEYTKDKIKVSDLKKKIAIKKLTDKYSNFFFAKNDETEDERRKQKMLAKQMERMQRRRPQFRSYSNHSTFNRNFCQVIINQHPFLTKDYYKHNFQWFDNAWMHRMGMLNASTLKFNLGFNGYVGRMIKRIKTRNALKYDALKKNQREVYTGNTYGKNDYCSSSESNEQDKNEIQELGDDLERLPAKAVVIQLGSVRYSKLNKLGYENTEVITEVNEEEDLDNAEKNEVAMVVESFQGEKEINNLFWKLIIASNILFVLEFLWTVLIGYWVVHWGYTLLQLGILIVYFILMLNQAYFERQSVWRSIPDTLLSFVKLSYLVKDRTLPFNPYTYIIDLVFWQFVAVDIEFTMIYMFSSIYRYIGLIILFYIIFILQTYTVSMVIYYSYLTRHLYEAKGKYQKIPKNDARANEVPSESPFVKMAYNELDNYILLIDSEDNLQIYDLVDQHLLNKLLIKAKFVQFKNDFKTLLTLDSNDQMHIYEIKYYYQHVEIHSKVKIFEKFRCVYYHSSYNYIFGVLKFNKNLAIYNTKGSLVLKFNMENFKIYSFAIDHQYNHIAMGSKEGIIKVYFVNPEKLSQFHPRYNEIQSVAGPSSGVRQLVYSPYSNFFICSGYDGYIKVFTISRGFYKRNSHFHICDIEYSIKEVCFTIDENKFMTCSSDNYIRIYTTSDWVEVFNFRELYFDISSCCFLNSGEYCYVMSNKNIIIKDF